MLSTALKLGGEDNRFDDDEKMLEYDFLKVINVLI